MAFGEEVKVKNTRHTTRVDIRASCEFRKSEEGRRWLETLPERQLVCQVTVSEPILKAYVRYRELGKAGGERTRYLHLPPFKFKSGEESNGSGDSQLSAPGYRRLCLSALWTR